MSVNRAASIRARLKQLTDTSKQDFNLTLTRYGLERLLYRLSISEHAPNFLLKGAELQRAIEATFTRRQTAMPSTMPIGLSDAFADDTTKQTQWRAFLNKNKLQPMGLRDVIGAIRARATKFGFPRP